jgi:phage N-6-adenine-methyltransferase
MTTIVDNSTGEIVPVDRDGYREKINSMYQTASKIGCEIGRTLIEAKKKLNHGEFEAMIEEDLPFSPPTARRLMSIAKHPILSNRARGHDLPQSWRTQYELTKLPEPVIEEKIESGELNPNTTRKEVSQWQNKTAHVSHNSGENEWYTPRKYTDAARRVMGEIDLDPASSELANSVIQATTYYTKEDDGLAWDWEGRVWMNPPYAQPLINHICDKFAMDYSMGFITEGVVLVNNATETNWFNNLSDGAAAVCFPRGRIKFIDKNGEPSGAPLQGQAILYFGENASSFADEFGEFGRVFYAR